MKMGLCYDDRCSNAYKILKDNLEKVMNCWFACDITAALLVVKNKSIALLWELNSIFM